MGDVSKDHWLQPLPPDHNRSWPMLLARVLSIGALALAGCGDDRSKAVPEPEPDASCPEVCDLGAQRCNGNSVELCGPGVDQCPAWGAPTACPAYIPICGGGACGRGCQDDCVAGTSMCDGTSAMKTCGVTGGDVCLLSLIRFRGHRAYAAIRS